MNLHCTEACNPIKEIKLCIQHSQTKGKLHNSTATYQPTHHKQKQSEFIQSDG